MSTTTTMDSEHVRLLSDVATERLLNKQGTVSSTQGGWMMIATILIEAWDLYAIAFVLIFIKTDFNPTAAQLGLVTAAVQGGALAGALLGGIFADRFGRKKVFIGTMVLFIVLALAQAFVRDIWDLIILRLLIGVPLGSDISNGYAYIMESMSKGKREQMGSRWQFMFGLGEVFSIIVNHADVRDRYGQFAIVARGARARRRPGGDPAVWPAESARDAVVAAAARPVRESEGSLEAAVQ